MSTVVGFEKLHVRCIIGILPHEREEAQDLYIDLSVKGDLSGCKQEDGMQGTLCYAQLAALCEQVAVEKRCQTIEHLAHSLAEAIEKSAHLPIESIRVRINKPAAIPSASAAFTEWEVQCQKPS